jgi:hypothetical protein
MMKMKFSGTLAAGILLILDLLTMSVSCKEVNKQPEIQQGQQASPSQSFAAGEGQACRDQIVSCYDTNAGPPTCPYPGQKIETGMTGSVAGCSEHAICVCRCPAIAPPKTDPQ